ncbi:MAG: diadenylate cyclase CdaA [Bacteroidetes bacterium]|nr:diadenylate cyclase CdaA [Bacteroidota bacterium]
MQVGFLHIGIKDLVDVILVALAIYMLYRLVRGTIALNISIGLAAIFFVWWLVRTLEMRLLSGILNRFIEVGVIALLIVFQQEIRRFLLIIGRNAMKAQASSNWRSLLPWHWNLTNEPIYEIDEVVRAARLLSQEKTGAIIVFSRNSDLKNFTNTGKEIRSVVSGELLISIFQKTTPLHDGAVIIAANMIVAASCILPVSQALNIPGNLGTRHRAAIGLTEQTDAVCVVVSEETGNMALAKDGSIYTHLTPEELEQNLRKELKLFNPESKD